MNKNDVFHALNSLPDNTEFTVVNNGLIVEDEEMVQENGKCCQVMRSSITITGFVRVPMSDPLK